MMMMTESSFLVNLPARVITLDWETRGRVRRVSELEPWSCHCGGRGLSQLCFDLRLQL